MDARSCVSKTMERIIFWTCIQLFSWQYSKYQARFLPGHSTVFQLIETYDHILRATDQGQSCMIFCDLSKAFDRVWHKGLLFTLNVYGITGNLFKWFNSFLVNRKQRVMYREVLSSIKSINAAALKDLSLVHCYFLFM